MFQTNTALIALNSTLINQNLLHQSLSNLKIQISNKVPINTKESILTGLEDIKPNLLILSSLLPGAIDLTEVIRKVKQVSPNTKTILVINENDIPRILNYVLINIEAIIWTSNFYETLDSTVKQLAKGEPFFCGKTILEIRNALQQQNIENKSDTGLLNLLTDRELEVLHSLTQGINYKQISKLLFISESTVKTHINNIFTKLSVNDRTQAVLYALNHGISSLVKKPDILKNIINEPVKR